jgi:hypothetical protein
VPRPTRVARARTARECRVYESEVQRHATRQQCLHRYCRPFNSPERLRYILETACCTSTLLSSTLKLKTTRRLSNQFLIPLVSQKRPRLSNFTSASIQHFAHCAPSSSCRSSHRLSNCYLATSLLAALFALDEVARSWRPLLGGAEEGDLGA